MIRQTLGSVRPIIARITQGGDCADSAYLISIINEAQQRLLMKGKFANTKVLYNFCSYDACITLPRELGAVLAISLCQGVRRVQNEWFEFIPGVGVQGLTGYDCNPSLVPRGTSSLFHDICGNKKLRIYADLTEADGAQILVRGLDENGNAVQTLVDGQWIMGEYISLTGTPQISNATFSYVESVSKPITKGFIRLYQVDPDNLSSQSISGLYAPSETLPSYRRYFYAPLSGNGSCGCSGSSSMTTSDPVPKVVSILAKRNYVPVYNDDDDLVITNIPALKAMCQAIEKYEANSLAEAKAFEDLAVSYLDEELKEWNGGSTGNVPVDLRYRMGSIRRLI
jgi:hypothetical protein